MGHIHNMSLLCFNYICAHKFKIKYGDVNMKKTGIKIIKVSITILQLLTLSIPIILQYLSDKKMGIARYLIFKKAMLSKNIFVPKPFENLLTYHFFLIAILIILILQLIKIVLVRRR